MDKRLLLVRKNVKLNQEDFGRRIGVTRSAICNYENGSRPISEQVVLSVCREFGVNREWLETGDGEMMVAAPTDELDALAQKYHLRHKDYVLIEKLVNLSQAERDGIFRFMQDVVEGTKAYGANPDSEAVFYSDEDAETFGEQAKALAKEQFISEKKSTVSASSVKESGAG